MFSYSKEIGELGLNGSGVSSYVRKISLPRFHDPKISATFHCDNKKNKIAAHHYDIESPITIGGDDRDIDYCDNYNDVMSTMGSMNIDTNYLMSPTISELVSRLNSRMDARAVDHGTPSTQSSTSYRRSAVKVIDAICL